ncbi:MAG: F0F1 ATP synthase subunit A [Candidatus Promineifilaceae bacterium]
MKKRYWVYLCLLGMIIFGSVLVKPVLPVIQLPGELFVRFDNAFIKQWFGGGITNTFMGTLIAWVIIVVMAFSLKAKSRTADEVPSGFYNVFEWLVEALYGFVESSAGKWAKNFFPFFMTFILFILVANWLELVPGVDSIGKYETMGELAEHRAEAAAEAAGEHLSEDELHHIYDEAMEANTGDLQNGLFLMRATTDENGNKPEDADYTIVPFVRAAATDLNFTLALALISVVMTQYYGFKAQGAGYLKKFFQFDANKIAKNPLGAMDLIVGILELVAEIAKILSFSFRLLGNIFAGQVLLFVMAFLLPVANVAFFGLEFFVGAIQAAVFAMLTLTFMSQATQSHDHAEGH